MKRGPKSSDDWVLLLGGAVYISSGLFTFRPIYLQAYLPSGLFTFASTSLHDSKKAHFVSSDGRLYGSSMGRYSLPMRQFLQ